MAIRVQYLELSTKGVVANAILDDNNLTVLDHLNSLNSVEGVLNRSLGRNQHDSASHTFIIIQCRNIKEFAACSTYSRSFLKNLVRLSIEELDSICSEPLSILILSNRIDVETSTTPCSGVRPSLHGSVCGLRHLLPIPFCVSTGTPRMLDIHLLLYRIGSVTNLGNLDALDDNILIAIGPAKAEYQRALIGAECTTNNNRVGREVVGTTTDVLIIDFLL